MASTEKAVTTKPLQQPSHTPAVLRVVSSTSPSVTHGLGDLDLDINSPVPGNDNDIEDDTGASPASPTTNDLFESKQLELTKLSTQRRLKRYLSAQDAARAIDIEFVGMRAQVPTLPAGGGNSSIFPKISNIFSMSSGDESKSADINNKSDETHETSETSTKKEILHGVSGVIRSGEFVALMGPSGAGKSSLLNVLGDRFEGEYTGDVFVNGKPRSKELKRKIGYVLQDDIILPNLTVRETLDFTALLRLPRTMTRREKMERVDDVVHVMGLKSCEHTLVQLVSGGERKRVSIANELLVNPSVIFLDEPTSGLDSTTAFAILTTLKELTLQGRTIICCVHQPSSQMFAKFDKLLLVASGHVVYFGPVTSATSYFKDCGFPCPNHYNPADFILELVTDNFESQDPNLQNKEEIKNTLIKCWKDESNSLNLHIKNKSITTKSEQNNNNNNNDIKIEEKQEKELKWQTTWLEQFFILLVRAFKHRKGHILSWITAIEVCGVCVLAGALWWQSETTEENLNSWTGAAFFLQVYLSFSIMFRGVVHFPAERVVIKRERQSGSYRLSSYYTSKLIAETPIDVFLPLIAVTIYFWMIGLGDEFVTYILYLLGSCLGIVASNAFGTFLGCYLNNFERAFTSLAVIGIFFMLIGGFLVKDRAIPDYISWMVVISQMRYAFVVTLLILLEDSGNVFKCAPDGETEFEVCEQSNPKYDGSISRKELLDFWDMDETIGFAVVVLAIQIVVWHVLAYFSLKKNTK